VGGSVGALASCASEVGVGLAGRSIDFVESSIWRKCLFLPTFLGKQKSDNALGRDMIRTKNHLCEQIGKKVGVITKSVL
jgi:hypothetical protein